MTVSVDLFTVLIFIALAIVIVSPVILVALWLNDLKKGALW